MLKLGTAAPDFALADVVTGKIVHRDDFQSSGALLVMFICAHCPYVKHIEKGLAALGKDYAGKPLGIVWKAPFRVDVTTAMKPGANAVIVKVTNLWVNRLVGDQQPNVARKYTYTAQQFYRVDSALLPSGLLGPVQIISSATR